MNEKTTLISPYRQADYDAVIDSIYQDGLTQASVLFVDKMTFISGHFLGKPYLNGALGEGPAAEFDENPRFRTDSFDCVTFVNTVLAVAISKNKDEFNRHILKINYYDSDPRYEKRFHFMSVDWNVQNTKWGLVRDVTAQIFNASGRSIAVMAEALIDRPNWFRHRTLSDIKLLKPISEEDALSRLQRLQALSQIVKSEVGKVAYLPLDQLFEQDKPMLRIFAQIPHGSVIEIVRPNWNLREKIGTNLNISHVGFVFRFDGELIFRHASLSAKRVVDVPLVDYLRQDCQPSPTVSGIHVMQCG